MNVENNREESTGQEPEFSSEEREEEVLEEVPEEVPEEVLEDLAEGAPEEIPEEVLIASSEQWQEAVEAIEANETDARLENLEDSTSDEQWQEAVEAIEANETDARLENLEDSTSDQSVMDADLTDESAADNQEVGTEKIRIVASDETVSLAMGSPDDLKVESSELEEVITATRGELKPAVEAILFVADEPLPFKQLCKVLGDVNEEDVKAALDELVAEYDARQSGLEFREIAGGWRISTRPQNHEFIRKYLKSRPTARLSLPALETLAVIAYKQPITVPEILEIRGVTSSSAIKTLLEKRLIVTKGRKETVGRPMMYGTSKEFLIQFGLKDLTELPSIEDFEDLAQ
jgi:segregation and condensation protein B